MRENSPKSKPAQTPIRGYNSKREHIVREIFKKKALKRKNIGPLSSKTKMVVVQNNRKGKKREKRQMGPASNLPAIRQYSSVVFCLFLLSFRDERV